MSVRRQIEDAIVDALKPLEPRVLGSLKAYAGEITGADSKEGVKRVLPKLPGILVATGAASYATLTMSRKWHVMSLAVELLVAAKSLRSKEETRRDVIQGAGAGLQTVIDEVHAVLAGLQLPVEHAGRLEPEGETPLVEEQEITIWRVTYEIQVDVRQREPANLLNYTEIATGYFLPRDEVVVVEGQGGFFTQGGGGESMVLTPYDSIDTLSGMDLERASIVIAGATSNRNSGTFPIIAWNGTQLNYANPNGIAEQYEGDWKVVIGPIVQTTTDVSQEGS